MTLTPAPAADSPGVAVITYLRPATRGGAYLVDACCSTCHKDVVHGAGSDLDDLVLGVRQAHCACAPAFYELADVDHVIPGRTIAIRAAEVARDTRRAEARIRRNAA